MIVQVGAGGQAATGERGVPRGLQFALCSVVDKIGCVGGSNLDSLRKTRGSVWPALRPSLAERIAWQ